MVQQQWCRGKARVGQEAAHVGREEGDADAGLDCGLVQQQLHADVEVELGVELPKGQQHGQEGEQSRAGRAQSTAGGSWGEANGYVTIRCVGVVSLQPVRAGVEQR